VVQTLFSGVLTERFYSHPALCRLGANLDVKPGAER